MNISVQLAKSCVVFENALCFSEIGRLILVLAQKLYFPYYTSRASKPGANAIFRLSYSKTKYFHEKTGVLWILEVFEELMS